MSPVLAPIPKQGHFVSPTLRQWILTQGCAFCANLASELHHVPSRGALGSTCDLLATPVCRPCHVRCGVGEISLEQQRIAVFQAWLLAVRTAPGICRTVLRELSE